MTKKLEAIIREEKLNDVKHALQGQFGKEGNVRC